MQNILKKVVKKFGRNKERVVSLYQAITLITLKQNIMTATNLINNGKCISVKNNGDQVVRLYELNSTKYVMTECTITNQFAIN